MISIPSQKLYDHSDSDNVCFLCGRPRFKPYRETRQFGFCLLFQRCECGLVKQTPIPNRDFFTWFFNSDVFMSSRRTKSDKIWGFYDYLKDEPCRLATSRFRYRRLRKLFPQNKPIEILKIGPSTGSFLHVAQQHGDHAIGCDISADFVDFAAHHYGVHIDHGRFEELGYPSFNFDMILMFNVLENIAQPVKILTEIHRTLKPGGRFIFNFVDMKHNIIAAIQREKYFLFRPPVTYIYSRDVLKEMLEINGFKVELNIADLRFMHLEKILTLLGWPHVHALFNKLHLTLRMFPTYAYPSRIIVASRVDS